ncbi:uncharacterized protein LY79DRAFT_409834 [Colletotrichum navitas]|uniref:Uncharacterized protein n=1 Tax=Colletotrichum navitas TaxID=681940 RepID=A0AAD8UZD5_9PEZI|nr:uncharacterized protein LY79DRAFT_409834 [Colletotrichum navitas]KAK1573537.1 hypothetical protein LY79DRAFT_409834 [Colletotrichum navitas]
MTDTTTALCRHMSTCLLIDTASNDPFLPPWSPPSSSPPPQVFDLRRSMVWFGEKHRFRSSSSSSWDKTAPIARRVRTRHATQQPPVSAVDSSPRGSSRHPSLFRTANAPNRRNSLLPNQPRLSINASRLSCAGVRNQSRAKDEGAALASTGAGCLPLLRCMSPSCRSAPPNCFCTAPIHTFACIRTIMLVALGPGP